MRDIELITSRERHLRLRRAQRRFAIMRRETLYAGERASDLEIETPDALDAYDLKSLGVAR